LAMNTEAIRQRHVTFASLKSSQGQQGAAGQTFPPLAEQPRRASADCLRIPAQVSHRPIGRATRAASQQRMSAMAR